MGNKLLTVGGITDQQMIVLLHGTIIPQQPRHILVGRPGNRHV